MANSNLTPNAGNLNLSDKNPRLTPLAGVLLAVGFAASLINTSGATTIIPGRGQLTATGVASGLTQQALPTPGTGALVATGQTAAPSGSLTPGTGSLVATPIAPNVGTPSQTLITPSAGVLTLARRFPLTPSTGALTVTGAPGSVSLGIVRPATGSLTLVGWSPTTVTVGGNLILTPSTGSAFFGDSTLMTAQPVGLSLTGRQPALLINSICRTNAGSLVAVGIQTSILGSTLRPGTGSIVATGVAAAAGRSVAPSGGALTLTGQFPSFVATGGSANQQYIVTTGALALVGSAPTVAVTGQVVLRPASGALVVQGISGTLDLALVPTTGTVVFSSDAGSIQGATEAPDAGSAVLEGQVSLLRVDRFITPPTAVLVVSGHVSNVNGAPPRGGPRFKPARQQRVFIVPLREERPV